MKKPKISSELDFKRFFRKVLETNGYWTQSVEPGRGGDVGAADLWIQKDNHCFPVELKYEDGKLRPEQVAWADKRAKFGLPTYCVTYKNGQIRFRQKTDHQEFLRIAALFQGIGIDCWFGREEPS